MKRVLPLLIALCGVACKGTSIHDISHRFAEDEGAVTLQAPSADQPNPALAAAPEAAMVATVRAAADYLAADEDRRKDHQKGRYARALYACALLIRGETAAAQETLEGITPRRDSGLSRENAVIHGTVYAVAACRCVDALQAFARVCDGEAELESWVEEYGSFAAIDLPDRKNPDYGKILERGVEQLRARCFRVDAADESEDARIARGRSEVRRLIGEQLYNEAASMLVVLKKPGTDTEAAPERWLATVAIGFFIVYAQVIPDLLPEKLNDEQKRWQRRQAMSVYDRLRRIAGWFIPDAEREEIVPTSIARRIEDRNRFYRYLYGRLLDAEVTVIGWITTR